MTDMSNWEFHISPKDMELLEYQKQLFFDLCRASGIDPELVEEKYPDDMQALLQMVLCGYGAPVNRMPVLRRGQWAGEAGDQATGDETSQATGDERGTS